MASVTLQEAPLGGARQTLLDTLERLRGQSPQVVVNLKRLAAAIGLSYGTVRNTISRLVREGVICTTQVRTGEAHGVCIEFLDDTPLQSVTVMGHQGITPSPVQPHSPLTVINSHQQSMTRHDSAYPSASMTPPMTADGTSVWSADAELIADLWPAAAEAGFSPAHLAHLRRAYHMQAGMRTMSHAACVTLTGNLIPDEDGEARMWSSGCVSCGGKGTISGPKAYVEPEVLRLQQQTQEQLELAQAQQELADAQALLNSTSRQR